jgi:aminopeptidase N
MVVHELAHQWFGDLLTCRDWSHDWLNEGFADFFEVLYKGHSLGADEAQYHVMQDIELYIEEDKERYRRPIVSKTYIDPDEVFDRHLYEKGSLVLNYIRYLLGEERFRRAIRHYTSKFKQQNVETDDFRRAIEEATGRNLEPYFEQWFYKGGYPDLSVKYEWVESQKSVRLAITQNQAIEADTPVFNFAVDVAVILNDGKRVVERVKVDDKEAILFLPAEERPLSVIFDPGNWLPKTVKLERPVEDSLFDLRNGTQATERIAAARHLATVASDKATRALEESILTDRFWGVRAEAAKALGKIGTNHAKKVLLSALQKVDHPKSRRAVVSVLGEFRGDDVASALQKTLADDASYFVEGEAAKSLGKTGHTEAFGVLEKALAKDSFRDVIRGGVFDGFGELKDTRAIPIAFEWSGPGHTYQARRAAALCLGKLGKGKDEVARHLFRLLKDPEFRVRMGVCEALAEISEPKAIPELEKVEGADLDARVRRAAREAVRNIRDSLQTAQELRLVREELDQVKRDNRELQERLERLETRLQKP